MREANRILIAPDVAALNRSQAPGQAMTSPWSQQHESISLRRCVGDLRCRLHRRLFQQLVRPFHQRRPPIFAADVQRRRPRDEHAVAMFAGDFRICVVAMDKELSAADRAGLRKKSWHRLLPCRTRKELLLGWNRRIIAVVAVLCEWRANSRTGKPMRPRRFRICTLIQPRLPYRYRCKSDRVKGDNLQSDQVREP